MNMRSKIRYRLVNFFKSQAKQIYKGGLTVLLGKIGVLLAMVPAALALIAIRALRPWVLIRFGRLLSSRIGHFIINTELYCCECDLEKNNSKRLDFFYHGGPVSNKQ